MPKKLSRRELEERTQLQEEYGSDFIGHLNLKNMTFNALVRAGGDYRKISHLQKLLQSPEGLEELQLIRNFGPKKLADLKEKVKAYNRAHAFAQLKRRLRTLLRKRVWRS